MVSSGTVMKDSTEVNKMSSSYTDVLEGLASSWKGTSFENIISQGSEFSSSLQSISNQISSFSNAIKLYESYEEIKNKYNNYVNTFNSQIRFSKDNSLITQYKNYIEECEDKMQELSTQIESALSESSSFTLEATSISSSISGIGGTDNSSSAVAAVSSNGGEFVADNSPGVYGHITSSVDGKTHTIYKQSEIEGWQRDCNRAAASSIASAYESSQGQAVNIAKQSPNGIGYETNVTNNYFANFGLKADVKTIQGPYDNVKGNLVSNVSNGNYVMFDLSQPHVVGKSGQEWTSSRHWVSVLDIKKTGSGNNDYAIFVSDSGHGGSATDHGLGTGWYSLDEFNGQAIQNYTVVSKI